MKKFTFGVAAAAAVLLACQDGTEPSPTIKPEFDIDAPYFECDGGQEGSFDNVVVQAGEICVLTNSTVKGNVKALENSILIMISTTVGGNVQGYKPHIVHLFAETRRNLVGGNIQIRESIFAALVCGTDLPEGNIQLEKNGGYVNVGAVGCAQNNLADGNTLAKGNIQVLHNTVGSFGSTIDITDNSVGGNLQVFKNQGPRTTLVQNNTVQGNLQCFGNTEPFVGGPNTARKLQGQCF